MATTNKGFNSFVSRIKTTGMAKESHFICDIRPPAGMVPAAPIAESVPFYVDSVNLPELALATETVKDYGLNREVVYDKMYGSVTMTFYCDQHMSIKKFFDDWVGLSIVSNGGVFNYRDQYVSDLVIHTVNQQIEEAYSVTLRNAFPKILDDTNMSASSKSLTKFRVQFTFDAWESYQSAIEYVGEDNVNNDNLRRSIGLLKLITSGANKDAIKSMVTNVGTRKLYDLIGKAGKNDGVAKRIDDIIGNSGVGDVLGKLEGIIL